MVRNHRGKKGEREGGGKGERGRKENEGKKKGRKGERKYEKKEKKKSPTKPHKCLKVSVKLELELHLNAQD